MRVLDIGCGWGGLALYLHEKTRLPTSTGVTLSEEQIKIAQERAAAEEAGVADHVTFELIDYRRVEGHVRPDRLGRDVRACRGYRNIGAFFMRKCRDLLTPDGVMLLHTIGRLGRAERSPTDWTTLKYIFPGGYNPALSEIVRCQ